MTTKIIITNKTWEFKTVERYYPVTQRGHNFAKQFLKKI